MQKIILASQSPRRKQLLEWAEIDFEVIVKETDETFPSALNFKDAAIHIARNKALAVADMHADRIIIAADTIVVCDGQLLGKPRDRADAVRILSLLSGNTHEVITGVHIRTRDKLVEFADVTTVVFNELTGEQISFYIDKYQPYDKAGAYAIQEWIGVVGIQYVHGDFYNVMGLPVNRVVKELRTAGVLT